MVQFGRSTRWLTAGVALAAAGCLTEPPGPPINQRPSDPPSPTLEWVGRYTGAASGVFDQVPLDNVVVEMVVTFDNPAITECPDCITVRMGDYFGRMHLFPQTSISARWSYELDSLLTTLTLQKFSAAALPGGVFVGTVLVETQDPDPAAVETITAFDFVIERR